MMSTNFICI